MSKMGKIGADLGNSATNLLILPAQPKPFIGDLVTINLDRCVGMM